MTQKEFYLVLNLRGIKEHDGFYRLKGYEFTFTNNGNAKICGKFPLPLAEAIWNTKNNGLDFHIIGEPSDDPIPYDASTSDEIENLKLKLSQESETTGKILPLKNITFEETKKKTPKELLFVSGYYTSNSYGLVRIIDCIRAFDYINVWAIGNE